MNITELAQYAQIFTGRKVVVLACGPGIADPESVKLLFVEALGDGVEFVERENDTELREVAYFGEHIEMMRPKAPGESFFFAHTKGTTHPDRLKLLAIRQWRQTMYDVCLSDIGKIDQLMREFSTVGGFRVDKWMEPMPRNAAWHFAGTFWWINSDRLFNHEGGHEPEVHRYGAEGYPGKMFPLAESANLHVADYPQDLYACLAPFMCEGCDHKWVTRNRRPQNPKTCPACHKRRGVVDWVELDETLGLV